jgi:hypothetical protein
VGAKKSICVVWLLVFALVWCFGCGKKEEPSVEPEQTEDRGEAELKDETIATLINLMEEEPEPFQNSQKKKRSLAQHILRDHIVIAVHFQNQQFKEMADAMKDGIKLNGVEMNVGQIKQFWKAEYDKKYNSLTPEQQAEFADKYQIELVIYSSKITLKDLGEGEEGLIDLVIDGVEQQHKTNCKSNEVFKFKILLTENGVPISNQSGEGEWPRDHSWVCPWI